MSNVLIFQPYLSNRKLSSGSLERQFRFLKFRPDIKVFALLDSSEKDYAEELTRLSWVQPIVIDNLCINTKDIVKSMQKTYNFTDLYITRTYFTPSTKENELELKYRMFDNSDIRYVRDDIPVQFSDLGVHVNHMIYDPLELNYLDIIPKKFYTMYSSMSNVPNAKGHNFAELGYYDLYKECSVSSKCFNFTFGGTSMSEERTDLLKQIQKSLSNNSNVNLFFRYNDFDNLIDNDNYEILTSQSLFTYTIPSQNPKYMSFTRMLLALSQGTIPLIHPDNNLDCLFGEDFTYRDDLKPFLTELIYSVDDLHSLFSKSNERIKSVYYDLLDKWYNLDFYQYLYSDFYNFCNQK